MQKNGFSGVTAEGKMTCRLVKRPNYKPSGNLVVADLLVVKTYAAFMRAG